MRCYEELHFRIYCLTSFYGNHISKMSGAGAQASLLPWKPLSLVSENWCLWWTPSNKTENTLHMLKHTSLLCVPQD